MEIEMAARKFWLETSLSLRESRELEALVGGHPGVDQLTYSHTFSAFTVKMKDANYWVASGMNIQKQIEDFLRRIGVGFEIAIVPHRQAA